MRKQRLWPWFEPPAAIAPKRYYGWHWDPAIREWVKDEVSEIQIYVSAPKYPKPTEIPRPAQELFVLGWNWNGRAGEWEEAPMPTERIAVSEPRPDAPTVVPSRTQPAQVLGWRYNFNTKVWEPIQMPITLIEAGGERPPKPEFIPGPEISTEAEGWSWSETTEKWVATIIMAEPIGFTPPRSLPPGVTEATVFEMYSFEQLFLEEIIYFQNQGFTYEAARQITRANFDPLIRMMYAQQRGDAIRGWQGLVTAISGHPKIVIQEYTVIGLLYLITAAFGYLIGTILEGLILPDREGFVLTAHVNTYLIAPDDWKYSRHIDATPEGRPIYVECDGIGTEYVRFKRGLGKGWTDRIDFPGGFLEEGYQFPYYVKYVWQYWVLEYVGMMFSLHSIFYALKKGDFDAAARFGHGYKLPRERWCADFDWYL